MHFFTSFITRLGLACLLLLSLSHIVLAQNNYVANSSNSSTPANGNTLVGPLAGNLDMTGTENTFVGNNAGVRNTTGFVNTFIGNHAGLYNTTGSSNVFLGSFAGELNTTGITNTFLGNQAGSSNTTGSGNIAVGIAAGMRNTSGYDNLFVGSFSAYKNTTGYSNAFIGTNAGFSNTTGNQNLFVGLEAGRLNTTSSGNVYMGVLAGYNAVSDSNTFVGYWSGYNTTTGRGNTFFGIASGRGNSTGSHNTFVGNGAGPASSNTDDNVYIGYNTGQRDSGSLNTLLGAGADVIAQYLQNATAIGAGAQVAVSNALVLGNNANVGIGTSTPATRLHVSSGQNNQSGVRLADLTASSPSTQATDQFLTVNERGDVVKARYQLRINNATEWSDKVFTPGYPLRSLGAVENYINTNQHLPGVPSAEEVAKKGIDLVRLNTTLLEKIEELTLYSIQQQKEIDELKQLVRQLVERK